jgi:hypothetical protein
MDDADRLLHSGSPVKADDDEMGHGDGDTTH